MPELSLLSALLVGLLGGVHCAGMCGGIVAALSFRPDGTVPPFRLHLGYNIGRVLSYTLFGALAGGLGASLNLLHIRPLQVALYIISQVVLVLLGLYLAGWNRWVLIFEEAGRVLWGHLQPYFKKLLPVRNLPGAFLAGMVWGWLPCGLVYSVLISALASGGAAGGAGLMMAFGLGTLPNLLGMGFFARSLQPFFRSAFTRKAAGLVVASFGAWGLLRIFS
ncbi:MAG: sulfite exporter TauE/SafE family protein [Thiobacillaceae bacterium]